MTVRWRSRRRLLYKAAVNVKDFDILILATLAAVTSARCPNVSKGNNFLLKFCTPDDSLYGGSIEIRNVMTTILGGLTFEHFRQIDNFETPEKNT